MTTTNHRPAAGYARVSTDIQREKHTIENQLRILPTLITQSGYDLYKIYIDDGVSAETRQRPGFISLVEDAQQKNFDAVFVVAQDRLNRSSEYAEWHHIKTILRQHNLKLYVNGRLVNLHDPDEEFMSDMVNHFSSYEKKKIVARMVTGKQTKAYEGKYVGGTPLFGYHVDPDTRKLVVEPGEARIVRKMFSLSLKGNGLKKISNYLNDNGLLKRGQNGKMQEWSISSVHCVLSNPAYGGKQIRWRYQFHTRADGNGERKVEVSERPPDQWIYTDVPAIVSQEEFSACQEAMRQRKTLAPRNARLFYLLGGIIWCAHCGSRMSGMTNRAPARDGSMYEYKRYVCTYDARNNISPPRCPVKSIRADEVEPHVLEVTRDFYKNPNALEKELYRVLQGLGENRGIEEIQSQIEKKGKEGERLVDLYVRGVIDRQAFDMRKKNIDRELSILSSELTNLKATEKKQRELGALPNVTQLLSDLTARKSPEIQKKALIKTYYRSPGDSRRIGIFIHSDKSIECNTAFHEYIASNVSACTGSNAKTHTIQGWEIRVVP